MIREDSKWFERITKEMWKITVRIYQCLLVAVFGIIALLLHRFRIKLSLRIAAVSATLVVRTYTDFRLTNRCYVEAWIISVCLGFGLSWQLSFRWGKNCMGMHRPPFCRRMSGRANKVTPERLRRRGHQPRGADRCRRAMDIQTGETADDDADARGRGLSVSSTDDDADAATCCTYGRHHWQDASHRTAGAATVWLDVEDWRSGVSCTMRSSSRAPRRTHAATAGARAPTGACFWIRLRLFSWQVAREDNAIQTPNWLTVVIRQWLSR